MCGLQEARPDQLRDLTYGAPEHRWFGRGRADGRSEGEHVPILWRSARFTRLEAGVFWHSRTPTVPGSRDHDRAITRMATWVRLEERASGRRIVVLNTHLDHRVAEARAAATDQIRRELDRLAGDDAAIVLGDLNDRPGSGPYERLLDDQGRIGLRDARLAAAVRIGPTSSLHGFAELRPDALIDHVFVSSHFDVMEHRVDDRPVQGRAPSDHHPVLVDVRWRFPTPTLHTE